MTLGAFHGHQAIVLRHPLRAITRLHSQKYAYIATYICYSSAHDLFEKHYPKANMNLTSYD